MDAFYASIEQRDDPALRGKPVIVGGRPNERGVVAAASYEARKYGIHSAMATSRAIKLCPHVMLVRGRMSHYRDISKEIRAILYSYTQLVEPLSLDEAFLDVTECIEEYGSASKIGREIKERVRNETQLTCSVGVAPNKFTAKIASDLKKPDGFVVVRPEKVKDFLKDLPVSRIWGVGRATESRLHELQINTIGDVRRFELHDLVREFGKWGARLHELSHGIDERPVSADRETKSISRETTFARDIMEMGKLQEVLIELAKEVRDDLQNENLKARTLQIKVRYADFTTITRSFTFKEHMDQLEILQETAQLLLRHKVEPDPQGIRLIGIGVSNLTDERPQMPLLKELDSSGQNDLTRLLQDLRSSFH